MWAVTTMDLTTRLKRGHVLRQLIIGLFCVALGVWGVYDYVWTIPRQRADHEKYVVASAVKDALEAQPGDEDFETLREAAFEKINGSAQDLVKSRLQAQLKESGKSIENLGDLTEDDLKVKFDERESAWFAFLVQSAKALSTPRPATGTQKLTEQQTAAYDASAELVNRFAEVTPPAKYDRIMKGLVFIPCLPIGLYMLFMLGIQSQRRYRLSAEGDLRFPNKEQWAHDEIADIDMHKWMSKSIAFVKRADGRQHKLDDYIHQDMHLIVGALAHRFHPDEWTEDARPIKSDEEQAAEADDEQVHGEAATGDDEPAEQPAGIGEGETDESHRL